MFAKVPVLGYLDFKELNHVKLQIATVAGSKFSDDLHHFLQTGGNKTSNNM